MKLRKLELKDAPFMLEWMHNKDITDFLQTDFSEKTIDDCKNFINKSWNSSMDLNMAVVDDNDIYMGTVSLKHITCDSAEFAITLRLTALGKGYSRYAMAEILKIGVQKYGLKRIYWCVSKDNKRAVRFYDKNGYQRTEVPEYNVPGYDQEQINSYIWYEYN